MVHIDINPVDVQWEFREIQIPVKGKFQPQKQRRAVVWAYGVQIYAYKWSNDLYSSDDWLDTTWRNRWDQFLGESFKRWVNESRTEEQED